jgi:hypothetical protein
VDGTALDAVATEQLARLLAAHIVEHRLNGAIQLRNAWVRVIGGGSAYDAREQDAMRAFLGQLSPATDREHRDSLVAEYLWHVLSIEDDAEPELVAIRGPKFHATAPGGDGLTVRRTDRLVFTLWEIKKHTGSHLPSVIGGAYDQLGAHAAQYLAEYSATEQVTTDAEMRSLFATLVQSWLAGESHANVGVAVVATHAPRRCFSTMRQHFAHLNGVDPCRGLLASIATFPDFANRVTEILWTGL